MIESLYQVKTPIKKALNMNITKSTVNYATRRNIDLAIDNDAGTVLFFIKGQDENFLEYRFNADLDNATLHYAFQVYGQKIEDLPAMINDVSTLHRVIDYVSKEFSE